MTKQDYSEQFVVRAKNFLLTHLLTHAENVHHPMPYKEACTKAKEQAEKYGTTILVLGVFDVFEPEQLKPKVIHTNFVK